MVRIVNINAAEQPRLHPQPGSPRWIPRLGHGQQRLAPLLASRGVTMTASPLHFAAHNPQLTLFTGGESRLGLVLDPCTHLRQLPPASRSKAFRALPFGGESAPFDPERDPIDERGLLALVTSTLDCQRAAGATLLLSPFHLVGAVGTRGRDLDLQLARLACEHFHSQRMDEPSDLGQLPLRRELYMTIAVSKELLDAPRALLALAEACLGLPVSGFWVKLEGFSQRTSRRRIRAGAGFLAALALDGRPVVSCGAGQLHLGLLVNDISTSLGLAEGEHFHLPEVRAERDWSGGRTRTVYHQKYLRSFRVGADSAARAFRASPCRCRRHRADLPPEKGAVDEHCAVIRAKEAVEALDGQVPVRREWLLASTALASHLAHDCGVDFTPPAVYEALFEGIDAAQAGRPAATG
ncbi:MAG: hypothetical protein ACHQHO_13890 [Solirubrobacterales bacterium]